MKTTALHPLPFARSYWVAPGQILAGFYPGDRDPAVASAKLAALLDCGVTHLINLMEADEGDHAGRPFHAYEPDFHRLARERGISSSWIRRPIRDLGEPTPAQMVATLDLIDQGIAQGGCVYVHCWGGKGRTGTTIGCWLARHGERNPLARLRQLTAHARDHFPSIPETNAQQAFVQRWRIGQ
jgi:hypothetical protein